MVDSLCDRPSSFLSFKQRNREARVGMGPAKVSTSWRGGGALKGQFSSQPLSRRKSLCLLAFAPFPYASLDKTAPSAELFFENKLVYED